MLTARVLAVGLILALSAAVAFAQPNTNSDGVDPSLTSLVLVGHSPKSLRYQIVVRNDGDMPIELYDDSRRPLFGAQAKLSIDAVHDPRDKGAGATALIIIGNQRVLNPGDSITCTQYALPAAEPFRYLLVALYRLNGPWKSEYVAVRLDAALAAEVKPAAKVPRQPAQREAMPSTRSRISPRERVPATKPQAEPEGRRHAQGEPKIFLTFVGLVERKTPAWIKLVGVGLAIVVLSFLGFWLYYFVLAISYPER